MSHSSRTSLLEEALVLLVRHFGEPRVRAALTKIFNGSNEKRPRSKRKTVSGDQMPSRPTIVHALELIRESDPEKHLLLIQFLRYLKERKVLPESQDIRHFAQLIGLKDIRGKSRKDMIPTLMRFLVEQPTDRLQIDLQSANGISEQERQRGFSVLTDKLLSEK